MVTAAKTTEKDDPAALHRSDTIAAAYISTYKVELTRARRGPRPRRRCGILSRRSLRRPAPWHFHEMALLNYAARQKVKKKILSLGVVSLTACFHQSAHHDAPVLCSAAPGLCGTWRCHLYPPPPRHPPQINPNLAVKHGPSDRAGVK